MSLQSLVSFSTRLVARDWNMIYLLSLLILPAYALGGYPGASLFMALLAALLAREIRELIRHLCVAELEQLCEENNRCESGAEVRAVVEAYFERSGALTVGEVQAGTSSD